MNFPVYPALGVVGILLSFGIWNTLLRSREGPRDPRFLTIYLSALVSALVGAKLLYIASEGYLQLKRDPIDWNVTLQDWLIGKSVVGALLGGYAGVEIAKKLTGYTRTTGDLFAVVAPLGLALGRVGCFFQGCCLGDVCEPAWWALRDSAGTPRWPAVPLEFGFNILFFGFAVLAWRRRWLVGQVFHVYLIAYGLFRFWHEFHRATPKVLGPLSGYQIAAAAVFLLGAIRFAQRAQSGSGPEPSLGRA